MSYSPKPMFPNDPAATLTQQDVDHLKILAILHYVYGAMTALSGLFAIFHLGLGIAMLSGTIPVKPEEAEAMRAVGILFTSIAGFVILAAITLGAVIALGGRNLQRRGSWIFGMVVACLMLLSVPLGTVLGVFTIIVLLRPNVKAVFQSKGQTNPYAMHPY